RHAARALRPVGRTPRPRRRVLARDAAEACALPRPAARAGPVVARRAVQRARRRGRAPARPRASEPARPFRIRRLDPRPGADGKPCHRAAGARMRYVTDVGTLARKDLLLELRARDTLPAMLLFIFATLVVFHF